MPRPTSPLVALAVAAALLAFAVGCTSAPPPVLESLRAEPSKTPVILLPGITGSRLRERATGKMVWGNGKSFFWPHDGGYAVALPIDHPEGEPTPLEASSVITKVRVLGLTVRIYDKIVRLMEANGYRFGNLAAPRADDTFFLFPYDWRLDNVGNAGALLEALERLRRARGEETLTVRLICQSNAARIARYLIKYGDASLEQAEAGTVRPPEHVRVDKLILVGTANGGALRTLLELNHGRTYLSLVGRRFLPETLFTFRAAFEELPGYRDDLFFDADGQPLDVDVFDAESWRRYGWSIYGPKVQARLRRRHREDLFGDAESARRYLERTLDRARRLHQVLRRDAEGFAGTRYYMIQNHALPTTQRGLLVETPHGWETILPPTGRIKDPDLAQLAVTDGDEHATTASQSFLSPQEKAALARPPVLVSEVHRLIMLHPESQQLILQFLDE